MISPGVEGVSWLRILLAFMIVAGMLGVLGQVLRRFSMRGMGASFPGRGARRLQIVENLPIDMRRRLIIVRCDGEEHLLLLGANQDIIVAANLTKNQSSPPA